MRVRFLHSLLVSAGGVLLSLALAPSLSAESDRTPAPQPKITGNYEQLVEFQQQALDQILIKAKAAVRNMQAVRDAINRHQAQQRQQQEQQKAQEQKEQPPPLRSLEQPTVVEQETKSP